MEEITPSKPSFAGLVQRSINSMEYTLATQKKGSRPKPTPVETAGMVRNNSQYNTNITVGGSVSQNLEWFLKHPKVLEAVNALSNICLGYEWRLVGGKEEIRKELQDWFDHQDMETIREHNYREGLIFGQAPTEIYKKKIGVDGSGLNAPDEQQTYAYDPSDDIWDWMLIPRSPQVIKENWNDNGIVYNYTFIAENTQLTSDIKTVPIARENMFMFRLYPISGYQYSPSVLESLYYTLDSYYRSENNMDVMTDRYAVGFWSLEIDAVWIEKMALGNQIAEAALSEWNNWTPGRDVSTMPGMKYVPKTMPAEGLDAIIKTIEFLEEEILKTIGVSPAFIKSGGKDIDAYTLSTVKGILKKEAACYTCEAIPRIKPDVHKRDLPRWAYLPKGMDYVNESKADLAYITAIPGYTSIVQGKIGMTPDGSVGNLVQPMVSPGTQIESQSDNFNDMNQPEKKKINLLGGKIIKDDKNMGESA